MPITAYCKKCARDVPPGDLCPHCGGKLAKSALRVAWCADHTPVRDWMSWNAVMRLVLPVLLAVLALILLLEGLAGGLEGIAALLRGGLLFSLLGLLALTAAGLLVAFILPGDDLPACVVDRRSTHIQQYLPEPTALKLLNTYASLSGQAVEGTNITEAKHSIERSMDLLVTAFENQLDKLFQSDALDVSADVAALEGMLNMDGLTGSDFAK